MGNKPCVSIIVPVFNCEKYIEATLQSILSQTLTDYEVIIVDDGSTDNTKMVVKEFAEKRTNIHYFYQQNSGVSIARNLGIQKSQGDYVCFLDGDDLWSANKLALQMECIKQNPQYEIICGNFSEVASDFNLIDLTSIYKSPATINHHFSGWVYYHQLQGTYFHIITLMIKREIICENLFDPSLSVAEDYDLWLKLSANYQIAFLQNCLAYYRRHDSSLMSKPQKKCFKALVLERNVNEFGLSCKSGSHMEPAEYNARLYRAWFTYGYSHFHSAKDYRESLKANLKALKYKPFSLTSWKYIVACSVLIIFRFQGSPF